jgi:hypothetical protein
MADSEYADQPGSRDPLEEAARARSQYTTDRPIQTLGDYSWQAPRHAPGHQAVRNIPFPYPEGGPSSGGGGAEVVQAGHRDRSTPQWNPEWDRRPGEDGEDGRPTTTGNGGPGGGYSPWGSHQPDFNDEPVPKIQGSAAGEPVTSGASPYL